MASFEYKPVRRQSSVSDGEKMPSGVYVERTRLSSRAVHITLIFFLLLSLSLNILLASSHRTPTECVNQPPTRYGKTTYALTHM